MPSLVPATTRSSVLRFRCSKVGLTMKSPSTKPTRTPASVRLCGMLDNASAAEAPVIASTSESLSRVGRDDQRDDLRLAAPAVREERADRAIDQAAREHFLFGRLAFALEEPAGDPARGVGVLLVIAGERQEVDPFARVRVGAGGHEDHGVAQADDHRAVGLLGHAAGFDGDGASADGNVACMHVPVFQMSCVSFQVVCAGSSGRTYLRMPRRLIRSA